HPKSSFAIFIAALLLLSSAAARLLAQQTSSPPPPSAQEPKIAVDVKAVNVLATVRDKHGKIITTLSKDDFALSEDGRPQSITYFVRETDLPLRLGLLVDTSLSQRRV